MKSTAIRDRYLGNSTGRGLAHHPSNDLHSWRQNAIVVERDASHGVGEKVVQVVGSVMWVGDAVWGPGRATRARRSPFREGPQVNDASATAAGARTRLEIGKP